MPACAYCGAETRLYDNGTPVCLKCVDERDAALRETGKEPPTKSKKAAADFTGE